jgi:hypothetical protein
MIVGFEVSQPEFHLDQSFDHFHRMRSPVLIPSRNLTGRCDSVFLVNIWGTSYPIIHPIIGWGGAG